MRNRGSLFITLTFAIITCALCAQPAERPKPWFSISIQASDPLHPPTHYTPDRRVILVTYTNTSDVDESNSEADPEFGLDMHVLKDGVPAEETDDMRALQEERHPTKPTFWAGSVRPPTTIKAGKSITFPVAIADYFDMTKPGTYVVTVSKETYPDDLAKSVTVWSNTITIVVSKPRTVTTQ